MIFLKVGKIKQKFKLKLIIAKYKYSPEQQIPKNANFKVKITRGSHQIQIFSTSSKKGSIKFPKTQHTIPMTLFYDESSNQYLQKTAEIKTYLCDENGNVVRTIGKTELNVAEYASKQKFGLQVEIEGQNKKIQQNVIITLQMILQRQDDDSKSVNTVSEDEIDLKSVQLKKEGKSQNKNQQRGSKSKDKRSFLFPSTAQSQVTVKSAQESKMKNSTVTETMDDKFSQQTQRKRDKRQKSPIRQLQENKRQIKRQSRGKRNDEQEESSRDENFFSRFANKISQVSGKGQVSIKKFVQKDERDKEILSMKESQVVKQRQSKYYNEDQETKNGSLQFRIHMATKKINSLQRENSQLRNEALKLKQVIQQLIQQKSQKQISQSSTNSKLQQQLEQFRKTLIEKEMRINELEGLNKLVVNREQQREKENKGLRNEVKQLKMKLEYQKNKLAKVLQTAMQSQNMELLEIVEKQINDQFY